MAFNWKTAATGAAIGSVVPGVGTVIGGALGGFAGDIGGAASDAASSVGGALSDASGKNGSVYQGYNPQYIYWGGSPENEGTMAQLGINGLGASNAGSDWANNNASLGQMRGPTAVENQGLSDQEGFDAGYDQAGSTQLAREAAMGQSPSQAAYLMQQGLNQSLANQTAMAGGARGNAGIALAQGNQGANIANLEQQAYTAAGANRASEMANAMGLYNQAANTTRAQDQSRLQMGNQMAQYNANANDQYQLGMGNMGLGYLNAGNQYLNSAMQPFNQQAQLDLGQQQLGYAQNQNENDLRFGVNQANADTSKGWLQTGLQTAGGLVGAAGGSGGSGSSPYSYSGIGGSKV